MRAIDAAKISGVLSDVWGYLEVIRAVIVMNLEIHTGETHKISLPPVEIIRDKSYSSDWII